MLKNYKNSIFIMMLMMFAVMFTQTAHAADLFTVPDTDKSKLWFLDVLFPDDLAASPLASVMTILNSGVLLIGGILAAYTLIAGTMATAHDGEMLGKKWSSMWIPVRTAFGTAMILPAAGGFCAAQVAVLWLIHQGVGLADTMWNTYASNPADGAVITTSASYQDLDRLAKTAFINNVCMIKAQQLWDKSFADGNIGTKPQFSMDGGKVDQISGLMAYSYGAQNGPNEMSSNAIVSSKACGTIVIDNPKGAAQAAANLQLAQYNGMAMGAYLPKDITSQVDAITQAHMTQFGALDNAMASLASQYVANNNIDIQAGVNGAVNNYVVNIDKAVRSAFGNGKQWDDFKQNIMDDGWFMAGAWSMKLIRVQDAINGAAHKLPMAKDGTLNYADIYQGNKTLANIMDKVAQDMAKTTSASRFANGINKQLKTKNDEEGRPDSSDSKDGDAGAVIADLKAEADKSISSAMSSFIAASVIDGRKKGEIISFSADTTAANLQAINPLLAVKGLGDSLTTAGWVLLSGAAGVGSIASGFGTITGNWFMGAIAGGMFVMPIVIPLWLAGDTLAVVLPMMPYVMWFGVCVGWMILCIEAIVGAPLWVVVHLHPDGDGVVGRGGSGYGLVLSLTLRPALMVIGLIAAYTMLPILGGIINETFSGAFGMISSDGTVGIIEALAVIAVYISLMLTVIKKSLSLIHVIPDEIMKWLGNGSGGQSMAGYAQSASKGMEAAMFTQTALNQVSQMSNSGGNALRSAGQNMRMKGEKQDAMTARAQKASNDYAGHMSAAGSIDQQNGFQAVQSANYAYDASQAAKAAGDQSTSDNLMDQARTAASRAVGFSADNKNLLPQDLRKDITPDASAGKPINETGAAGDTQSKTRDTPDLG